MKKFVSIIGFVILVSCSNEPFLEVKATTIDIPQWLVGTYDGLHTQKELEVLPEKITFQYLDVYKEIYPSQVLYVKNEATRFLVFTDSMEQIVFNKSSLDSEINVRLNDLNLGWFRQKKIK